MRNLCPESALFYDAPRSLFYQTLAVSLYQH
jgi:hypothetical protein